MHPDVPEEFKPLLSCEESIGVFPSKAEPFGLVFVESMPSKCPVIGVNSGGPKDCVSPDVVFIVGSRARELRTCRCADIVKGLGDALL